jgi:hypothetical protein
MKTCHICKHKLSLDCFYSDKRYDTKNKQSRCKDCRNDYNKKYKHKWKLYSRRNNKKRRGLTLEQFEEQLTRQNGLCVICGLPEIDTNQYGVKDLAIDHNHQTGRVRGLLCVRCNRALGLLNVDNFGIMNLQKAIDYLGGRK